jgi:hypothetical protein
MAMPFRPKGLDNFCIGNKVSNLKKGGFENIGQLAAHSK